jgi:hypothetical protein
MIREVTLAALYWVFGVLAFARPDLIIRGDGYFIRRFPKAFTTRLSERAWYPVFLRTLGAVLLLFAALETMRVAAR